MPATILQIVLEPETVVESYNRIKRHVVRTPILTSSALSRRVTSLLQPTNNLQVKNVELFFKAEQFQKTGSFKFRGALNSILSLSDDVLVRGLATTSSGNHAKALSVAACELAVARNITIPVSVVMPDNALKSKVRDVEALGTTVLISGPSWAERAEMLMELCDKTGATLIGCEDLDVVLGQGTVGVEMGEQMLHDFDAEMDAIITPCGTGSMLSGVALAFKHSTTKVFGVEPAAGADDAARSRKLGYRITHVESDSIADGLRSPLSPLAWEVIRDKNLVDDMFSVTEEQIIEALRLAATELKTVIEPSASVGLAALLFNKRLHGALEKLPQPCKIGVVFSGGNLDFARLGTFLRTG